MKVALGEIMCLGHRPLTFRPGTEAISLYRRLLLPPGPLVDDKRSYGLPSVYLPMSRGTRPFPFPRQPRIQRALSPSFFFVRYTSFSLFSVSFSTPRFPCPCPFCALPLVLPCCLRQCALDAGCVFYADMDIACPLHHEEGVPNANGCTKAPFPST